MKLAERTIWMRPAVDRQLVAVAIAEKRTVSAVVQDCIINGVCSAYAGSPEAAPLDDAMIWSLERKDK